MFLTRFGLSRPIVVRMALILIVLIGIYCYKAMPRFLDPDLTIGEGVIYTICPGFSPEEMESRLPVVVVNEKAGSSAPGGCLTDLLLYPGKRWIDRDVDVHDPSGADLHDDEDVDDGEEGDDRRCQLSLPFGPLAG